jgi:hypothetical protein
VLRNEPSQLRGGWLGVVRRKTEHQARDDEREDDILRLQKRQHCSATTNGQREADSGDG